MALLCLPQHQYMIIYAIATDTCRLTAASATHACTIGQIPAAFPWSLHSQAYIYYITYLFALLDCVHLLGKDLDMTLFIYCNLKIILKIMVKIAFNSALVITLRNKIQSCF